MQRQPIELDLEEVREAEIRRAVIVTSRLRPSATTVPILPVGVGAVLWGGNAVLDLWLSGYATQRGMLEAALVKIIIEQRLLAEKLIVHAEELHAGLPPASSPEALDIADGISTHLQTGRLTVLPNGIEKSQWAYRRARKTSEFAQSLAFGWAFEVLASGQELLDPHIHELGLGLPPADADHP